MYCVCACINQQKIWHKYASAIFLEHVLGGNSSQSNHVLLVWPAMLSLGISTTHGKIFVTLLYIEYLICMGLQYLKIMDSQRFVFLSQHFQPKLSGWSLWSQGSYCGWYTPKSIWTSTIRPWTQFSNPFLKCCWVVDRFCGDHRHQN